MQLSATALAPVNSYGVLADFIRLITRRRSSSIIHTPSQRPRATQHRIAHCISRAPESHSRPTICDLSARPRGLSLGGDRRGSNPRPSLEPQSDDICFQLLPEVAESAYLSRSLCSRLPDVSGCSALGGVRSGVKWHQPLPLALVVSSHRDLRACTRGSSSSVAALATRIQEPHAVHRLDPALGHQLGGSPAGHPLTVRNRKDLFYAVEDLPDLLLRPIMPQAPLALSWAGIDYLFVVYRAP